MAADEEKTMKLVTNLDRSAIEGKLAQVRSEAQSANLIWSVTPSAPFSVRRPVSRADAPAAESVTKLSAE